DIDLAGGTLDEIPHGILVHRDLVGFVGGIPTIIRFDGFLPYLQLRMLRAALNHVSAVFVALETGEWRGRIELRNTYASIIFDSDTTFGALSGISVLTQHEVHHNGSRFPPGQ